MPIGHLEGKLKNQSNLLTGSPSSGVSPSPNVRQPVGEKKANGEMAVWSTPKVSRVIITPTEAVTKAFSWVWEFHKEKTETNPRVTDSIGIPFTTQDVKFNFAPSWFLKSTLGLKYTILGSGRKYTDKPQRVTLKHQPEASALLERFIASGGSIDKNAIDFNE